MKTTHKPVGETEINALIEFLNNMTKTYYEKHYPNNPLPSFEAQTGTVNVRIVQKNYADMPGSAYCFVEIATGKIMKPGGFKSPEPKKYERGNVNNPETWENCCQVHGIVTYR